MRAASPLPFCLFLFPVGECGLDYARTHFCDKETQMKYFLLQLQVCALCFAPSSLQSAYCSPAACCYADVAAQLAREVGLPLYLHSRDTMGDFCRVMASAGRGDAP